MAVVTLAVRFGYWRGGRAWSVASQERLAELSGLHRDYIGAVERAERAERMSSIVQAERRARALGTTFSETCLLYHSSLGLGPHRPRHPRLLPQAVVLHKE